MFSNLKMEEYMESELSDKNIQKYSAWVPVDPTPSYLYSAMSFLSETYKYFEPNC